jgi:hypothetical protein
MKKYIFSVPKEDLESFGYLYEGMIGFEKEDAKELFDSGQTVYLLYPDNTESMVSEIGEIEFHDGYFGIEDPEAGGAGV